MHLPFAEEPRAWLLNLDAEAELEAGARYQPTAHLARIVARESRRLVHELTGPGDVVLTPELLAREPDAARGLVAVAWSPTPRALATLAAAGARTAPAPDFEVLRRVNARPFATELRAGWDHDSFNKAIVTRSEELPSLLARPSSDGWLVRRTFGAAGRGRRRLFSGTPTAQEQAWLEAGLRHGPLVIEPWVRVLREYTRSGMIQGDGTLVLSTPCFQTTTDQGAWTDSEVGRLADMDRRDDEALAEAAERSGRALFAAGYTGPFGIDAYRHERSDGAGTALNVLSEINARYTMDWARAMTRDRVSF